VLICRELGDQIIGHLLHDATHIEAREKPVPKPEPEPEPKEKRRRGRPRKGEERPPQPATVLEQQQHQSLEAMLAGIPNICDVGAKKNSQGHTETWVGYKLHISTAEGGIPIAALLSSASTHDSQVALPLMALCHQRVTSLYELADSAYCSVIIREKSRALGHVLLIDHNPRRGEKNEFLPHEAERYKARSGVERTNSDLKDNHSGRHVRVRGTAKVYTHLMYGILVIAAEQLLRLLT
jgi:Transposase DDE domain